MLCELHPINRNEYKRMKYKKLFSLGLLLLILLYVGISGCQSRSTPKPRGFFRIALPEKHYEDLPNSYPFSFQIPRYAHISDYQGGFQKTEQTEDWININFPDFNANIYITYKPVEQNLAQLIEDAHTFVYKHTLKADGISQKRFDNSPANVSGVLYHIKGNTASSIQFFCTDSATNFLRGALYFNAEPNRDSLAPVIDFLGKDVEVILSTMKWKNKTEK